MNHQIGTCSWGLWALEFHGKGAQVWVQRKVWLEVALLGAFWGFDKPFRCLSVLVIELVTSRALALCCLDLKAKASSRQSFWGRG